MVAPTRRWTSNGHQRWLNFLVFLLAAVTWRKLIGGLVSPRLRILLFPGVNGPYLAGRALVMNSLVFMAFWFSSVLGFPPHVVVSAPGAFVLGGLPPFNCSLVSSWVA